MNAAESQAVSRPVVIDVMGGDHGPEIVILGALQALRASDQKLILVGDQELIERALQKLQGAKEKRLEIVHSPQFVSMEESPGQALRGKSESSLRVAFELVRAHHAAAVVSVGNTGAMMAAGLYVCGTLPAIARPAIASLIPRAGGAKPAVLVDAGANVDCHAHQLVQFAVMGDLYARLALGYESVRIALLSNGTEASKGNDVIRSAAQMLQSNKRLQFVGYVEGHNVSSQAADVIVCDGFVGNVMLKAIEGSVGLAFDSMRACARGSLRGTLGLMLAWPMFKRLFHDVLSPSAYGGAPLLGLSEVAVVCHGASDCRAVKNAVLAAQRFVDQALIPKMRSALGEVELDIPGSYEDDVWDKLGQRLDKKPKDKRLKAEI